MYVSCFSMSVFVQRIICVFAVTEIPSEEVRNKRSRNQLFLSEKQGKENKLVGCLIFLPYNLSVWKEGKKVEKKMLPLRQSNCIGKVRVRKVERKAAIFCDGIGESKKQRGMETLLFGHSTVQLQALAIHRFIMNEMETKRGT